MTTVRQPADEFGSSYVLLGSDGIGYIATVNTSPAEAAKLVAGLRHVSEQEWSEFLSRVTD